MFIIGVWLYLDCSLNMRQSGSLLMSFAIDDLKYSVVEVGVGVERKLHRLCSTSYVSVVHLAHTTTSHELSMNTCY